MEKELESHDLIKKIENLWALQKRKATSAEELLCECEEIEKYLCTGLKQLSEEFPEEFEKLMKTFEEAENKKE